MRKMYIIVVILSLLLLSGCGKVSEPLSAREKIENSVALPSGAWYTDVAQVWEREFLSESLRPFFFGEEAPDYSWVLYLGAESDTLCEILYAVCHTEREARTLAAHLSARIETLKREAEGRYADALEGATVERRGKSVLYTCTEENGRVLALLH